MDRGASLVGYRPRGCKESDMTEHLSTAHVVYPKTHTTLKINYTSIFNKLTKNILFVISLIYFLTQTCGLWDFSFPTRG